MVPLMKVKDLDSYYERLNVGVSMSKMWNTLQTKAEYKTEKSEKGYQQVAKTMAGNIARGIGANADLAEILTMCQGAYFPAYGQAGKKAIMEYLRANGLNISEADLARQFVEYDLDQSGNVITPEFDNLLQELFDENKSSTTPEVQIAYVCGDTVKDVKAIEQLADINEVDLLYNASKDAEKTSIAAGTPTPSPKIKEMVASIPLQERQISEDEKKVIFSKIDELIQFKGEEKLDGVFEYIGMREI